MISLDCGIQNCIKTKNKLEEEKWKNESFQFISESFRKTCCGEGFPSLNEWQKNCKTMWNLEYIGWANAEDFMEVQNPEKGKLFYGTWVGPYGRGEVYCRKK